MMSSYDMWAHSVCATDLWGQVNGQLGLGLKRVLAGSGWAGLGWADPDTWHAVVLPRHCYGLQVGFVYRAARTVWSTVNSGSRSMDRL